MFHAQCRELSLSTGAFSHSRVYDRSVAAPIMIIIIIIIIIIINMTK